MKGLLRKKILIPVIIILTAAAGAGFYFAQKDRPNQTGQTPKVAGVGVQIVSRKNTVSIPFTANGQIKGKNSTLIRSLVDGTLASIAPVGNQISQGEELFRINNQSIETAYQNALDNLTNAQISLSQTLSSTNSSEVQARIGLSQAEENLALAQQAVEDAKVTGDLNLKKAHDAARLAYTQGYNTLEKTMRYLGGANIREYAFQNLINSNQEVYFKNLNQFTVAKETFSDLPEKITGDIQSALTQILAAHEEINELNDGTITLLEFAVTGNGFSSTNIQAAKSQVDAFQANLNQLETELTSSANLIENTKEQNRIQLANLERKAEIAKLQLQNAQTALKSQESAARIQEVSSRSQLNTAQSQLASARRRFENLQLPSPFSGVITSHRAEVGSQLNPGEPILEIGSLDIIEVKIEVTDSLTEALTIGQRVSINDEKVGQITVIEPAADASTGKVTVTVEADNSEGAFTAGTIATVEMDLQFKTGGAIVVPLNSVKVRQNSKSVLVVRNGTVEEQLVQIGELFGNFVEITEGLQEGDQVVVENGGFLTDGDPVRIEQTSE